MRSALASVLLCAMSLPAAAFAAESAAPAAPTAAFSVEGTDIGTLLDTPATKAVLARHIPSLVSNPQIDMARSMTLKQIQQFAGDMITDEVLAKIDADLKALPAAH